LKLINKKIVILKNTILNQMYQLKHHHQLILIQKYITDDEELIYINFSIHSFNISIFFYNFNNYTANFHPIYI
jgi:hypothetical protein